MLWSSLRTCRTRQRPRQCFHATRIGCLPFYPPCCWSSLRRLGVTSTSGLTSKVERIIRTLSRRPPGRQRTSLWWRRKSNPRLRSRHCLPGLKLWSVSNKLSNIRCRHLQLRRRLPTPAITRQHRFRRLHLRLRVITIADTTADTTVGITAAGTIPATRYITIRSPLHTRSIPRRPTGRGQHSLLRMAGSRAAAVDMSAVEFVAVVATRVTGDRRTIWGSIWIHVSCSAH